MQLAALVNELQQLGKDMRQTLLEQLDENMLDGQRSTLEYLSKPRNSYIIRMKNEAFSAIRTAYSAFVTEWRHKYSWQRQPRAWELIEGVDMHLTTAFAEFAAHKLAHSRMHSSTHAQYVGVAPARADAVQLRMTLNKLVNRSAEYVQNVPAPDFTGAAGTSGYQAEAPQYFIQGGVSSSYYSAGTWLGDGRTRNPRHGIPGNPPHGYPGARVGGPLMLP
jgi:hypothetical protein